MVSEKLVNVFAVVTALVVALVRHGIQTKWGPWDGWSSFLSWWFIHVFALYLLYAVAGAAIAHWHKFFVGSEGKSEMRLELLYYVTMTVLVAALAIGILSFGPFTFEGDF